MMNRLIETDLYWCSGC